jgi:hypothetical protein
MRKIFFSFLSVYQVGCVCRIPSLYDGDLMQEEEVLLWLIEQKTTDTIEQVTDKVQSQYESPPSCWMIKNMKMFQRRGPCDKI